MNAYDITVTTLKGSKQIKLRMEAPGGRFMDLNINMRAAGILINDLSKCMGELMDEQTKYIELLNRDLAIARKEI